MAERIGQLFGNYRLSRLLGEGGFAEVYLGEHLHMGTLVAVKVLRTKLITHEQEEFLREARMIASLEHSSIVHVLDCGIEAERKEPFIVMQYAPNGTLRQRHPNGTRLSLPTIKKYLSQVTSALQYAHDSKFIHRDVKPENILLGSKDELLLSDFGIALISSSSSSQSTKAAAGTVAYMAPEQVMGKPRTASDQYALGIMVYEWLIGTTPFHGSFSEMCAQHLYAPPPSLCEKLPWLNPSTEQVVFKALAKEPQARFASVTDFAIALEQSIQSQERLQSTQKAFYGLEDSAIRTLAAEYIPDDARNDRQNDPYTRENILATPMPFEEQPEVALLAGNVEPDSPGDPGPVKSDKVPAVVFPVQNVPPLQITSYRRRTNSGLFSLVGIIIAAILIISTFSYLTISHALKGSGQASASSLTTPSLQPTQAITQGSPQQPATVPTLSSTAVPTSPPTAVPTPIPTPSPTPTPMPTPTSPPEPKVYHVTVDSSVPLPGVDTGITVTVGEQITITAHGWATYGSNSDPTCDTSANAANIHVDPDGQRENSSGGSCPPRMDQYVSFPSSPVGELMAGIGPDTPEAWFAAGSSYTGTISVSGHLYFVFNDGYYADNIGQYQVTITISPSGS